MREIMFLNPSPSNLVIKERNDSHQGNIFPILANTNVWLHERDIRLKKFNIGFEEEVEGHVGKKTKIRKNNKGDVIGTSRNPKPKIKFIIKGDKSKDLEGSLTIKKEIIGQDEEQAYEGPNEEEHEDAPKNSFISSSLISATIYSPIPLIFLVEKSLIYAIVIFVTIILVAPTISI